MTPHTDNGSEQGSLFTTPAGESSAEEGKPRVRWSGPQIAALLRVAGLGPVGVLEIVKACPEPHNYDAERLRLIVSARVAGFMPSKLPTPIERPDGVELVGIFDQCYPALLRSIPDPPPVLWVRGNLGSAPGLAVVGTRHPSRFGRGAARAAVTVAVDEGLSTVSGLALGIDTLAHQTALDQGGHTVAVLGGQLLTPTPSSNQALAEAILGAGGALVSEVPPEDGVRPHALVRRNRIQSGMSVGTFIAETAVPGGTLHTARFTLEQRRALIVARPGTEFQELSSVQGNIAMTDPDGCDPNVISATGPLASELGQRRPLADYVIDASIELPEILAELVKDVGRSPR